MKELLIGSAALLIGLAIGGLWPMSQVRDLERQLSQAQQEECRSTVGRDLAGLLHGRPLQPDNAVQWEDELGDPEPTAVPRNDDHAVERDGGAEREEPDNEVVVDEEESEDEEISADERIDAMRTGLEIRRIAARNALLDEAAPDDDQLDAFDGAVDTMNGELNDIALDLVNRFEQGGTPTRRDAMLFAADTLEVLIAADEAMNLSLDEDQIEAASEEALDPLQYLEPGLIDLLSQIDREGSRR